MLEKWCQYKPVNVLVTEKADDRFIAKLECNIGKNASSFMGKWVLKWTLFPGKKLILYLHVLFYINIWYVYIFMYILFLRFKIIVFFSFSFSFTKILSHNIPFSLSNIWPLFWLIVVISLEVHICLHILLNV